MNSATVTGVENASSGSQATRRSNPQNGTVDTQPTAPAPATAEELRRAVQKKYRHVTAVHSKSRPSTLSHDSTSSASFLGFRNLMVIVLGESFSLPSPR